MLNNEEYSKVLEKPIRDMTIGDVVEYFDIICAREHNSDEDVARSATELKSRFIMEALYKSNRIPSHEKLKKAVDDAYLKICIDTNEVKLPSSYEIAQSRNYLDSNYRPLSPKMLRDRQRAKELKNLVRVFCEERDAGRLIHPNNGNILFDSTNGKTRLIISASAFKDNSIWVRVISNSFVREEFYINANFKRTPFAYNWWKMYSRRITKKLGKIICELERGEYDE